MMTKLKLQYFGRLMRRVDSLEKTLMLGSIGGKKGRGRPSVWLFVTPWTVACQASLSITNCQSLPKPMSTESVMPSSHLIICHPLLLLSILPSIRVFSTESALPIRWPKYWSFTFNISPSNEHPGLIFKMDWLDLLAVQGTLKSLLQHQVQKHQFFSAQPSSQSNSHIHTWLLEKPQPWLDGPLLAK